MATNGTDRVVGPMVHAAEAFLAVVRQLAAANHVV